MYYYKKVMQAFYLHYKYLQIRVLYMFQLVLHQLRTNLLVLLTLLDLHYMHL